MEQILRKEKTYFKILLIFASLMWLVFIIGTIGFGLLYLLLFYIFILFTHSALISWLKGNAVEINAQQFSDLDLHIQECCQKLNMPRPTCYLMNGNGLLNAFATRFLRRNYVVLLSDVVDAFEERPEILRFYIGHELGHIKQDHIFKTILVAPAVIFPLLFPAYRRSCEYSCDQFGRLCCSTNEEAVAGLMLLMAGLKRWKTTSPVALQKQLDESQGFWLSYHELTASYPWLSKRVSVLQNSNSFNFKAHSKKAIFLGLLTPGFLPGSLFPIFFVYVAFLLALISSAILTLNKTKNLFQSATSSTSATISGSNETSTENPAFDSTTWENPVTKKTITMPEDFKSLPYNQNLSSNSGRFTFDANIYYSYIAAYGGAKAKNLPDYLQMLTEKNVYKYIPDSVTYREYQGMKLLSFKLKENENEPKTKLTQQVTIWLVGDYFWEFYSDYDLKDSVSAAKHEKLFDLLFNSSLN